MIIRSGTRATPTRYEYESRTKVQHLATNAGLCNILLLLLCLVVVTDAFHADLTTKQRWLQRRRTTSIMSPLASNNIVNKNFGGNDGEGSYSDSWLRRFFWGQQKDYQLGTNAVALYNEAQQREQREIKEWQDSFERNGLADFVPPISDGMECLMVGDGLFGRSTKNNNNNKQQNNKNTELEGDAQYLEQPVIMKLPWEVEAEAAITSLRILEASPPEEDDGDDRMVRTVLDNKPLVVTAAADFQSNNGKALARMEKDVTMYDCIVDKGLMDAVLVLDNNRDTVRELVHEASNTIRELGIFVVVTRHMSEETKEFLTECSKEVGLDWKFDLDGITNEQTTVSVARRYMEGEMPEVGKLSRYFRP